MGICGWWCDFQTLQDMRRNLGVTVNGSTSKLDAVGRAEYLGHILNTKNEIIKWPNYMRAKIKQSAARKLKATFATKA